MKRTPLRRVSKKLSAKLREYSILKRAWLRLPENKYCKVCPVLEAHQVPDRPRCRRFADKAPHHTKRRGPYLNDTTTWLPTCDPGHYFIETHANLARELGLIIT